MLTLADLHHNSCYKHIGGKKINKTSHGTTDHSNTQLVLAVEVAARFRNPPPYPAPPVSINYGVISLNAFYIVYQLEKILPTNDCHYIVTLYRYHYIYGVNVPNLK